MKINEVIQTKRKALNMTQLQLAEKLDVSDKTVSRWELGTIYPNIDMIPKIAAILGISINELFGDNGNISEPINNHEKRDYKKIVTFKLFLFILIGCSILSIILFFAGIMKSEENSKAAMILIIISAILFALSSILFYINRTFFAAFYKEKFYINEYRLLDAKITTIANFINSFMLGAIFLFSPKFLIIGMIIFTIIFVLSTFFLKNLEYRKKYSFLPFIPVGIIYLGLLCLSIYSFIGHPQVLIVPCIILNLLMNVLSCIGLLFFSKK